MVLPDPAVHIVLGSSLHPFQPQLQHPIRPPVLHSNSPVIVWFRGHDLRVHDHVALDAAVATERPIIALYVLERGAETDGLSSAYARQPSAQAWGPLSPNGNFALGRVQRWYLHHSLCALRDELKALGVTLALRRVDCAEATTNVVCGVAKAVGASAVFWNERQKPRAYPVDRDVHEQLAMSGIVARGFWSETLMEPSRNRCERFDDFQSYTTFWINSMRVNPPPRPSAPLKAKQVQAVPREDVERLLSTNSTCCSDAMVESRNESDLNVRPLPTVESLQLLDGLSVEGEDLPGDVSAIGCAAAKRTLARFLSTNRFRRFATGSARRDGMVTGKDLATSRLSPHVRFGEISPRVLFYAVVDAGAEAKIKGDVIGLESARTFLKNMSLREFGYYMLRRYPTAACKPIMPEFEVFPWAEDKDGIFTEAWESGTTGFPIVDAAMRQLLREGWIHNRMRFLVASFFCKYLLLPWPMGAAHLVRTLVDGDEACNSLGWQWTAGCNSDSFPFSTLVNPLSLHHHTRSTAAAANFVRQYVPELTGLPDSLVFTPWRATDEERRLHNISIVPHADYRSIRDGRSPSHLCRESKFRVYPSRIVDGPGARARARNAMEVMRRIFSAQRQCRTIVVDQTVPRDGPSITDALERESLPSRTADKDSERKDHTVFSLSELSSGERDHTSLDETGKRGIDNPADSSPPQKKRRLDTLKLSKVCNESKHAMDSDVMSVSHITDIPRISSCEVDLLLSTRSAGGSISCLPRKHRRSSSGAGVSVSSTCKGLTKESGSSPDSSTKRPRSLKSSGGTTDGRFSVKSLLTNAQACPEVPKPSPKLPEDNSYQFLPSQHPSNGPVTYPSATCEPRTPLFTPPFSVPPPTSAFQTPLFSNCTSKPQGLNRLHLPPSTHAMSTTPPYGRGQPPGFASGSPTLSLQHSSEGSGSLMTAVMPVRHSELARSPLDHMANVRDCAPRTQQDGRMMQQPASNVNRCTNSGMFQGIPPLPMMPAHLQQQHAHSPQMLVPIRSTSMMGVPQLAHPSTAVHGQVHSQETQPRFFTIPHQPPSAPVFMYPAMSPYMDIRVSGLHGPMQPVMHPMLQQQPGGVPIGFTKPDGYSLGVGPNHGHPGAGPSSRQEFDIVPRSGPRNSKEREAIARKMAAMDYYDEAYGGKHWEQWQAIALHLLEQYEFSEDTDRETSKAYVRLCVLKDELRNAHPEGPRVTVNHCKEVFHILRLPVTGEWDRRGHGGVRGPYCYGCVKRGTVQK